MTRGPRGTFKYMNKYVDLKIEDIIKQVISFKYLKIFGNKSERGGRNRGSRWRLEGPASILHQPIKI